MKDLLAIYKKEMSPVRYRVLLNKLDDLCVDEGGRLHELGSLPMAKVPQTDGEDTCVRGGYGNLFKKMARDDGVMDVVKFN